VTFYEPNPDVEPTGEEAGEYLDDGPLRGGDGSDDASDGDPTRRPTGSPPLPD
jgi:hypothetical protein